MALPPWAEAIADAPEAIIRSQDIPRLLAALRVACEALEGIRDEATSKWRKEDVARAALARIAEGTSE